MDINTLNNYLYELNVLKNHWQKNPDKARDLQTKIMDALRELNLYDSTSVKPANAFFKPFISSSPDPYHDSITSLISHLESKIAVYDHRLELAAHKAKKAIEQHDSVTKGEHETLKKAVVSAAEAIKQSETKIATLNSKIVNQNAIIAENETIIHKKISIWKIKSGGFWTFIVGSFIAISFGLYEIGKDNATKLDDTEKATLRSSNTKLKDSIDMMKLKIDSLEKFNKKG
ncbi:hypothetical protein [Sphingobacterium sp. UBA6320]|uniref:hypothetical protein n=1 Tax=Sphingobacterium sp. UBA6320 TaxID=1947510 RepID=UPI0025CBA8CC|nr:hypothetical protein [Sphingobacterium sp. UBA6320]